MTEPVYMNESWGGTYERHDVRNIMHMLKAEEEHHRQARPNVTDRAPYWAWEMFDQGVPCLTLHPCTSTINALAKDLP